MWEPHRAPEWKIMLVWRNVGIPQSPTSMWEPHTAPYECGSPTEPHRNVGVPRAKLQHAATLHSSKRALLQHTAATHCNILLQRTNTGL